MTVIERTATDFPDLNRIRAAMEVLGLDVDVFIAGAWKNDERVPALSVGYRLAEFALADGSKAVVRRTNESIIVVRGTG